uniref:Protein kinase putative n=1 Tax=Albugo laibachii Nc14 TaxID=890382 RepID=F0WTG8_9STRA|nr:protein kinase putative [Albugo laibachii Nc14]|eukprot:CCA24658.1 protein kinase putative [Albugo laibachii Nc14]
MATKIVHQFWPKLGLRRLLANGSLASANESTKEAAVAARIVGLRYLTEKFHVLQIFLLAGYGIMFTLCVILICYMRYNRTVALRGDVNAARKIILPCFEPLLWILGGATGVYTVYFCIALAQNIYTNDIAKVPTEVFYSGRQSVFLSVIVFMLQKSVSIPALQRTVLITFILSTYTIPVVWLMVHRSDANQLYWATTISRALLLLLYTYVFINPPPRASKRTIREFCVYAYMYYALLFLYGHLFYLKKLFWGFTLTYCNLLWGSLCPLVIWRVLKADTEYWRGMGQRACALQSLFRQKNNVHELISSQGLHVLIEMHRKFIIDFAYLEMKQRIGVGASAVVFNGILHSKIPVAIKVYTPSEFTEDTVAQYSHEAALCGALHHPNIVKFYGMCVCPPTICLVSELCQGSLEDVTKAIAKGQKTEQRQQFQIDLGYILDATRAVAYLHSFSPPFVHRDIKPANFLVDAECTVKLTDFGESRSLPRSQIGKQRASLISTHVESAAYKGAPFQSVTDHRITDSGAKPQRAAMTVRGTVDYMAPEVINGKAGLATYGEAADVYSLAITIWDILCPNSEKYPRVNCNNHMQIFQLVVDGKRPILNTDIHPTLCELLQCAWHPDANMRPSAVKLVHILESIQEEVLADFSSQIVSMVEQNIEIKVMNHSSRKCFTGYHASEQLVESGYVNGIGEALRLGNAFMDAGLVHHVKHSRAFEYSDSTYYFDDTNIHLCQPITTSKVSSKGSSRHLASANGNTISSQSDHNSHTMSFHSDQDLLDGMCECRKLGQKLEPVKVSRRRFRKKLKAVYEENMLTTQLLANETSDFEDFDLAAPPCA